MVVIIEGKKVIINNATIRGIRKGKTANEILFKDKLVISLIINKDKPIGGVN